MVAEKRNRRMKVKWFFPETPDPGKPLAGRDVILSDVFPMFDNECEQFRGGWRDVRPSQVRTASVIVLLRGSEDSEQIYEIAKREGIPFLPIPFYGGKAAKLFIKERAALQNLGIDLADLDPQPPSINPTRIARIVVDLAKKASSPILRRSKKPNQVRPSRS